MNFIPKRDRSTQWSSNLLKNASTPAASHWLMHSLKTPARNMTIHCPMFIEGVFTHACKFVHTLSVSNVCKPYVMKLYVIVCSYHFHASCFVLQFGFIMLLFTSVCYNEHKPRKQEAWEWDLHCEVSWVTRQQGRSSTSCFELFT